MARTWPKPREPTRPMVSLYRAVLAVAQDMSRRMLAEFSPTSSRWLASVGDAANEAPREDAKPAELKRALKAIDRASARSDRQLEIVFERVGNETAEHSRKDFKRQAKTRLGVDLVGAAPSGKAMLDAFVDRNVALIKTVRERKLDRVRELVERGWREGKRWETIAGEIVEHAKTDEWTARRIARDQVAKLHSAFSIDRMRGVGVKEFLWVDSHDGRVRPEHHAANGNKYSITKGHPSLGFPGDPILCRCYPEPVFDEDLEAELVEGAGAEAEPPPPKPARRKRSTVRPRRPPRPGTVELAEVARQVPSALPNLVLPEYTARAEALAAKLAAGDDVRTEATSALAGLDQAIRAAAALELDRPARAALAAARRAARALRAAVRGFAPAPVPPPAPPRPQPAQPATRVRPVAIDAEVLDVTEDIHEIGRIVAPHLSPERQITAIANLVSIDPGDMDHIKIRPYGRDEIHITGISKGGSEVERHLERRDGRWIVRNDLIKLKPGEFPKGYGTQALARQVEALRELGIDTIETTAAGSAIEEGYNGYYTWPRLGYDGAVPDQVLEKMPEHLRAGAGSPMLVSEVMRTAEGREWWRANGGKFDARFDTRPGSRSSDVLEQYIKAKGL